MVATEIPNLAKGFTEKGLDSYLKEAPTTGEIVVYDRGGPKSVPGLALRIVNGSPAFQIIKKINGKMYRRTLGDRRVMTIVEARDKALELIKQLERGQDPNILRKQAEERQQILKLTYREALEAFIADNPSLAEGTKRKYRLSLTTTFKEEADKPLSLFTEKRVKQLHEKRSQESKSRADQDFRVLRLLWNWVRDEYKTESGEPILGTNPVSEALNRKQRAGRQGWNMVGRRERIIPEHRLPDWFGALYAIRSEGSGTRARKTSCDLLEALVLTGLRFNELAELDWKHVDLGMSTLTVIDTSSKNRRPLVRPLSRRVREIIEAQPNREGYVFPGRHLGKSLDTVRTVQLEIERKIGLWITPHDTRRVFASAAVRAEVPQVVVKRLLNHLSGSQDVTDGYQFFSLDVLRDYSQAVEDHILRKAGVTESDTDDNLTKLIANMSDEEKRKLLFELSRERIQ